MNLQDFPSEVLEHIFEHLDVLTLTRVGRVCKRWYGLVDSMENHDLWKKRSLREIDPDALRDMLPYDPTDSLEDRQAWKNAYHRWSELGALGRASHCSPETIVNIPTESPIMCTVQKGQYTISGQKDGRVHVWDGTSGEDVNTVLDHVGNRVVGLAVLSDRSTDQPGSHWFLAAVRKHGDVLIIELDQTGDTISITKIEASLFDIEISSHRSVLVMKSDGGLATWSLQEARENPYASGFTEVTVEDTGRAEIQAVGYWNDELTCVVDVASCMTMIMKQNQERNWKVTDLNLRDVVEIDPCPHPNLRIKNCFVARGIIFIITGSAQLLVSVDGSHFTSRKAKLGDGADITSVKIFGNILALGTNKGFLYVYRFRRPKELLDLDLNNPSWRKEIRSGACIKSVCIDRHPNGPILSCHTRQHLHILQWKKCPTA